MKQLDDTGALAVLERITAMPGCPAYFHYLAANLRMKQGDWQGAWAGFVAYGKKKP
jgi:hypothetical protein